MKERIALAGYAACVDFMLRAANLLDVTYRDVNAGIFFLLWPAVTLALLAVVLVQAVMLLRRR